MICINENVIIRKGNIDDAEGKGYVHYKSWIETYTGLFPEEKMNKLSLQRSISSAREHPENTYVAVLNDKIVAFACYLESRDKDLSDTGEIVAIYVLQEFQGLGIGKRLIEACYEELKSYSYISLWVLGSNYKAVNFYESQGFEKDGVTKNIYDRTAIRMIKRL